MAKSKLKAALDAHKGVDYKKVKDKKKLKSGEKQKRAKEQKKATAAIENGDEDLEGAELSEDDEEGGVLIDQEAVGTEIPEDEEKRLQAELKALLGNKKKLMEIDSGSDVDEEEEDEDEDEWESAAEDIDGEAEEEEDEDEEDVSSGEEQQGIDLSRLEYSDSDDDSEEDEDEGEDHQNGTSKTNGVVEDEADGEDIPLSDIESLASDERGDIIPHQRLTINNKAALEKAHKRIALPLSKLAFSAHQSITSQTNTANSIPDIDDDLNRELAFYAQSLDAVKRGRVLLTKEGVPFSRPNDYFAEMVKSDEHMGRVKDKLRDEAASKKASLEARRQRDLKKFGKQVQVAKMQERAKEKRETLDRINVLKRKRAGAMPSAENEPDLFDVELEDAETTAKNDRQARKQRAAGGSKGEPHSKRQKKNDKFGYGGKKRFSKSNDAESSMDSRGYPGKNMKKSFKGAKARPGKDRRAKARL